MRDQFKTKIQALLMYHEKHGYFNVPTRDGKLQLFVKNFRSRGTNNAYHVKRLNDIGFTWLWTRTMRVRGGHGVSVESLQGRPATSVIIKVALKTG